nr:MAG TPA: hypothetical protein [Caudoviricetes sp.]
MTTPLCLFYYTRKRICLEYESKIFFDSFFINEE